MVSLPFLLCFVQSSVCTEMTGLSQELYKVVKGGMYWYVSCNTTSQSSCCFYAVLISFLPLKLHKDVNIEAFRI